MSSNLKVNTILPSTGTTIGIGTVGGLINVVGNIDVNSTSGISTFNDLEIADKIIHTGDTNTTIRFPVGDVISAETNGAERLRITSAGTLLLGTSTGALANGNGIVIADATAARLSLKDTTNGVTGTDGFDVVQTGTDAYLYHRENGSMIFGTNATERLRIDSSGRVMIGTTAASTLTSTDDLTISTSGSTGITLFSATGNAGNITFGDGTSGDDRQRGLLQYHHSDDTMRFFTNAARRMTIDSSGKVMIGTTSPSSNSAAYMLTVADPTNSSGNCGITIRSGNTGGTINQGSIFYSDATSGAGEYAGYLQYDHTNSPEYFRIGVASNPRFYVYGNGNAEITDGDLKLASGHGIDFSATSDASGMTSELLDDYEEGSWTPNIRNTGTTATWTGQTGRYVKIGQQVTVWFNADGGSSPRSGGTSSSLIMTGLPFSQSIFGNPILGSVGANKSSGTGLYSTTGVILSPFGQGGTQVRFGVGGQPINFGIDYVAGCFTYTAAS